MQEIVNWFSQIFAVTLLNLRTITERRSASISAMVGVAGVVAVFVAILSIDEGFRITLTTTGSPDTAIVLRSGSDSEMTSMVTVEDAKIIADAPGVSRGPHGPLASKELFVIVDLPKRTTGTDANVPLRGVDLTAFDVREKVHIIAGRKFEPGHNEIVVGSGALQEFAGIDLGSKAHFGSTEWDVVGIFDSGGSLAESEIWTDANILRGVYHRGTTSQAVYVKLASPGSFTAFKDALTSDPRLNVKVMRETEYYESQSLALHALITILGVSIAFLMGVGAVFGALITMYSAVASRAREIATLRALGFVGSPVVVSVLAESLVLALIGGGIGGALAYFAFNGYHTATMNWQTFSQVTFAFRVTPKLLIEGITYSLIMGSIGGLLPAIRAARLSVVAALRDL
jgi:putative ABC transport system permease protein